MEIIPAIDLMDGKVVRLSLGDFSTRKEYADDPVEMAKTFEAAGLSRLHLVDLDGARTGSPVNTAVLRDISNNTTLTIDFGGGIKSDSAIEQAFAYGANQVTAGSIAVRNPEMVENWLRSYGPGRIILGADVRDLKISVGGWTEDSGIELFDYLEKWIKAGITDVVCTDIGRDGMLQGPAIDLYKEILQRFPPLRLVASGGVSTIRDLEELQDVGVAGAIVGKAIYEGRIKLEELSGFAQTSGAAK